MTEPDRRISAELLDLAVKSLNAAKGKFRYPKDRWQVKQVIDEIRSAPPVEVVSREEIEGILFANLSDRADDCAWIDSGDFYKIAKLIFALQLPALQQVDAIKYLKNVLYRLGELWPKEYKTDLAIAADLARSYLESIGEPFDAGLIPQQVAQLTEERDAAIRAIGAIGQQLGDARAMADRYKREGDAAIALLRKITGPAPSSVFVAQFEDDNHRERREFLDRIDQADKESGS